MFLAILLVLVPSQTASFTTLKELKPDGQQGLEFTSAKLLRNGSVLSIWEQYKINYNKNYARGSAEDMRRLQIFADKLKRFEEHNKLHAQGVYGYSKGINKFTDWTKEETQSYSCYRKSTNGNVKRSNQEESFRLKETVYTSPLTAAEAKLIPESLDWRKLGRAFPAKDQGGCKSCWAFATVAAVGGQLARIGWFLTLSEQNLMDCISGTKCTIAGSDSVNGYEYIARNGGIDLEADYNYTGIDEPCRYMPQIKPQIDVSGYVTLPTNEFGVVKEGIIIDVLATVGPVAAGIVATDVQDYQQGILYCNPGGEIDHEVVITGYGTEDGADYWIVKNSWGQTFGESGYFRILRGRNMCRIEEELNYPLLGKIKIVPIDVSYTQNL